MSSQSSMTRSTTGHRETSFIESSGGLLTEQLIYKLRDESCSEDAVKPSTFEHPGEETPTTETALESRIGEIWADLEERWDEVTRGYELYAMDVSEARTQWMLKLFEALGFEPAYQQSNLVAGGIEANLSHLGWEPRESVTADTEGPNSTPPVLHTVRPDKDRQLDDGNHRGAAGRQHSPHDELQRYLNSNEDTQWSIVTDGLKLRLVRDYYHTYTRGYVEFDLENIFTERNYDDFRALYRLCHASRFTAIETDDSGELTNHLEELYQVAVATGVKIGQDLQENVIAAIEALGNGFLHKSETLRKELEDTEEYEKYYEDLLYVVYRLLFLLYAEQRNMIAGRGTLYAEEYSVSALRERANSRREVRDTKVDLWKGLETTFNLVEKGNKELGVPCYNGLLFDDSEFHYLEGEVCPNQSLVAAIQSLTIIHQDGVPQRISYADLGVEELGSVYESLLEFQPEIAQTTFENEVGDKINKGDFYLSALGTERKETGSYYTDPSLVNELIESALKPTMNERLADAKSVDEKEEAILNLDVCDPACGSAAFLVAANNTLAQRLAKIRTDDNYPPSEDVRQARRDVLQHCIYGVDLNPMAVELAKVSLWINSAVQDKPLNYLDHHIKCGNALLGANQDLLEGNFPEDAYDTSGGRDWHKGNEVRDRIRTQNRNRSRGENERTLSEFTSEKDLIGDLAFQIEAIEETDAAGVSEKATKYQSLLERPEFQKQQAICDLWVAAFYWPMDGSVGEYPSPDLIEELKNNYNSMRDSLEESVDFAQNLATRESFFHWELEFPSVFLTEDEGFDVVIGNPPWEKPKLSQKEWFAGRNNKISALDSTTERNNEINSLEDDNPELYEQWKDAQGRTDSMLKFLRESGRFELSGSGDLNTYPIFTELSGNELISGLGRAGLIVKTGIATDYHTRHLFGYLATHNRIDELHDFENTDNIFEDVEENERFCLLTLSGRSLETTGVFSFHNQNVKDLRENSDRQFELTSVDFEEINPNTKTCPTFKDKQTKDISLKIYRNTPVLVNDTEKSNTWDIKYNRMLDMSTDDDLFADNKLERLQTKGYELTVNNRLEKEGTVYRPLYEGKFINQLDHRFGTFEGIPKEDRYGRKAETNKLQPEQKQDGDVEITPRYWVEESDFDGKVDSMGWDEDWLFAFRNVARSHTDYRTTIGTITPFEPHGHSAPVLTFDCDDPARRGAVFASVFTSFTFDFALRSSLSGANFTKYVLKQLPMHKPETLQSEFVEIDGHETCIYDRLEELVVPLIWTSHSLDGFGQSFDWTDSCFEWKEDRRIKNRAMIEALVAKSFNLKRDEFEFIMDQFDILKEREIEVHGKFRSKKQALEAFDRVTEQTM